MPDQFCYCGAKMVELQPCTYRCPNCVPSDTIMLGDNKAIADIESGDMCIGESGHLAVTDTFRRQYDGEMISIRGAGILRFEATPDHPILVMSSSVRKHKTTSISEPYWKPARDLIRKQRWHGGDYMIMPRIVGSVEAKNLNLNQFTTANGMRAALSKGYPVNLPLTRETAWLLGLYVAEGVSASAVIFSLGKHEDRLAQRIVKVVRALGYSPSVRDVPTGRIVDLPSRILARAFPYWCGIKAPNKRIPEFVMFHKDLTIPRSFLEGYVAGDGGMTKGHPITSTVSHVLALQLQLLCARLGLAVGVRKETESGVGTIQGRKVRLHAKYVVNLYPKSRQMRVTQQGILVPVKEVRKMRYKGVVHNLETDDHTYLVSNIVVHNCGGLWDCEDVLGLPK